MIAAQFPEPSFRLKQQEGKQYIFDAIRKAWILLSEEEWVRQNFVQYLVQVLKYPISLIAVEKEIVLFDLRKRFDILVYDEQHQPWMMIECKAPSVALTDATFQQVLRYHMSVPAQFLVITNGSNTFAWRKGEKELELISRLPGWNEHF